MKHGEYLWPMTHIGYLRSTGILQPGYREFTTGRDFIIIPMHDSASRLCLLYSSTLPVYLQMRWCLTLPGFLLSLNKSTF